MKVTLSPRSKKQLKSLSKLDQVAVARKIRKLKSDGRGGAEKLRGYRDIFRTRVGDYRLVYRRNRHEIYVILIGYRKDIYNLTKRLRH